MKRNLHVKLTFSFYNNKGCNNLYRIIGSKGYKNINLIINGMVHTVISFGVSQDAYSETELLDVNIPATPKYYNKIFKLLKTHTWNVSNEIDSNILDISIEGIKVKLISLEVDFKL